MAPKKYLRLPCSPHFLKTYLNVFKGTAFLTIRFSINGFFPHTRDSQQTYSVAKYCTGFCVNFVYFMLYVISSTYHIADVLFIQPKIQLLASWIHIPHERKKENMKGHWFSMLQVYVENMFKAAQILTPLTIHSVVPYPIRNSIIIFILDPAVQSQFNYVLKF